MKEIVIVDESTNRESVFLLAQHWNELSPKQLLFLIALIDKNLSAEEIKLKMLLNSVNGRAKAVDAWGNFRIRIGKCSWSLSSEQVHALCGVFDFLFVENEQGEQLNIQLTRNPFPVVRTYWVTLYGPADGLSDITYEQFAELQVCLSEDVKMQEKINEVISLLYRTRKGKKTKWVSKIPQHTKMAIMWYLTGCFAFLQERFPITFSGGGEKVVSVADCQFRIIDALAKNDVTKKEQVKNALLYDALYTMEVNAELMEKIKS